MVYALLLCAGKGERLNTTLPKALVQNHNAPIFMHSLHQLLKNKNVDEVYIVVNKSDEPLFHKVLEKYNVLAKVKVLYGSEKSRHETLKKALNNIKNLKEEDIILTHDSARINLNQRIINENIQIATAKNYACTMIPLADSVCVGKIIKRYIPRKNKYIVQTPQTFKWKLWKKSHLCLLNTKPSDAFSYLNVPLREENIVKGSVCNYKITYREDLE